MDALLNRSPKTSPNHESQRVDNSVLMMRSAISRGAGLEGEPVGDLPSLASFMGDNAFELEPQAASEKIGALQRPELEELAQQLFLALKKQEGRLMDLRRTAPKDKAAPRRAKSATEKPALGRSGGEKKNTITRARTGPVGYEALPEVFKRLTIPSQSEENLDEAQLPSVSSGGYGSPRQVSEEQAQQIFDRLYNCAREQRVKKHLYSEIGRMTMPNPVPTFNSVPASVPM
jgi:hypothetical protein